MRARRCSSVTPTVASQAEREKLRRLAIEREYVEPDPIEDWHEARRDERPSAIAERVIRAAGGIGWKVTEMARTDWHPPKWETDDSGRSLYVAQQRRQYHVHAIAQVNLAEAMAAGEPGRLASMSLLYIDGAKRYLKLGYTGSPVWLVSELGTNSIAKFISENGIRT